MPSFEVQYIGSHASLLSFAKPFPIALFLFEGSEHAFLVDAHLGSSTAREVRIFIEEKVKKPIVLCYSHYHWDHVWGGSVFADRPILSHESCPGLIQETWDFAIEENGEAMAGEAAVAWPTIVFNDRVAFPRDGIEFFHGPGHTPDSIYARSLGDGVLFVADLLERPLPFVSQASPASFARTLSAIEAMDAEILATTHSGIVDKALLGHTRDYLLALDKEMAGGGAYEPSEEERQQHAMNRRQVTIERLKLRAKEKRGKAFDATAFLRLASSLFVQKPETIAEAISKEYGL